VPSYTVIRGTRDLLPDEAERWAAWESMARDRLARYGFREIRTPFLETTDLFARGVGASSDIVAKEMYTFAAGDEQASLRPEATASVCRAFVQHGLDRKNLNRLFYLGPMFRYERPQKGRYRQFHQLGVEAFGEAGPAVDAEVIELASHLVEASGVRTASLGLGSIGDPACRPAYRDELASFLRGHLDALCEDCHRRAGSNPLRVFDCKNEACQKVLATAPRILDRLCDACGEHFDAVRAQLDDYGVAYEVAPGLVRGLDYYTRTTFELRAEGLGAQDTVVGGGRYDGLVELLGGRPTPAVGWALGLERLMLAAGEGVAAEAAVDLFVVTLGEAGRREGLRLVQRLRRDGLRALYDPAGRSLSGQMKRANRSGARWALFLGDAELEQGVYRLKDLAAGDEQSVSGIDALLGVLRS
jgi:histidyl-tRNA synthetase